MAASESAPGGSDDGQDRRGRRRCRRKALRKHGGGYYALLAVGTFMYLEFTNLISSIRAASGIRNFLVTELFTFLIESIVNTLLASLWPFMWFRWMGTEALY